MMMEQHISPKLQASSVPYYRGHINKQAQQSANLPVAPV